MTGFFPRAMFKDVTVSENFSMARTFRNEFIRDKRDYLTKNFNAPSWIHEGNKDWRALLTGFILKRFEKKLVDIRLFKFKVVRATQYGIVTNPTQLFAILELYNPVTSTFSLQRDRVASL